MWCWPVSGRALLNLPTTQPTPVTFLLAANDLTDPVAGTFDPTITGLPAGWSATVDYAFTDSDVLGRTGDGNDIAVTLSFESQVEAVPEPGAFVLAALGLLSLGYFAWKRRR